MTFLAFYKHFHPDGKDLILPKWARWASAVLCLIFFHNATPETEAFGKRLQTAMEAAGITVQVEGYGTSYANGPVAPGVSLSVGDDNLDIAKAISELLVNEKVVSGPIHGEHSRRKDYLEIQIAPLVD